MYRLSCDAQSAVLCIPSGQATCGWCSLDHSTVLLLVSVLKLTKQKTKIKYVR